MTESQKIKAAEAELQEVARSDSMEGFALAATFGLADVIEAYSKKKGFKVDMPLRSI